MNVCIHGWINAPDVNVFACVPLKDIYVHNPNVHWDDIMGLEDGKRLVKEAIVYPIKVSQVTQLR